MSPAASASKMTLEPSPWREVADSPAAFSRCAISADSTYCSVNVLAPMMVFDDERAIAGTSVTATSAAMPMPPSAVRTRLRLRMPFSISASN